MSIFWATVISMNVMFVIPLCAEGHYWTAGFNLMVAVCIFCLEMRD